MITKENNKSLRGCFELVRKAILNYNLVSCKEVVKFRFKFLNGFNIKQYLV